MAIVCPTVTAFDLPAFQDQLNRVSFAKRLHIDLMDGTFAPTTSPGLDEIHVPHRHTIDIHLMYQHPMEQLPQLIRLKPHMVIIHNEADVHHMHFAAELHKHDIKAGLAILQDTPIEWAAQIMHSFDQVLIFSGSLGHHGGKADLSLLSKVQFVREHHSEAEIAWDGGINDQNLVQLVKAGVNVLNAGGYIQQASNPRQAYESLNAVIYSIDS